MGKETNRLGLHRVLPLKNSTLEDPLPNHRPQDHRNLQTPNDNAVAMPMIMKIHALQCRLPAILLLVLAPIGNENMMTPTKLLIRIPGYLELLKGRCRKAKPRKLSIFLDQQLLGEELKFNHLPTGGGSGSLFIGSFLGGDGAIKGKLDNLRVSRFEE